MKTLWHVPVLAHATGLKRDIYRALSTAHDADWR